ncbi:MAG TPA: PilZ domain-containing protein [Kofleriaceae bacterium]|nr:PilZ domain-containing protein [Kofleriaceae bacterium]
MKDLEVRFETGREVLNAYWGYLSDGGLIIPDQDELAVGEPVSLSVLIESSRSSYSLSGKVVRRDVHAGQAVIAFSPGQPQDMLLTQALSDAEQVPARRARRFRVALDARVVDASNGSEQPLEAQLVDLSEFGCCFRLDEHCGSFLPIGTPIEIAAPDFAVGGRVVWTRHTERGVAFASQDVGAKPSALESVREYLRRLSVA